MMVRERRGSAARVRCEAGQQGRCARHCRAATRWPWRRSRPQSATVERCVARVMAAWRARHALGLRQERAHEKNIRSTTVLSEGCVFGMLPFANTAPTLNVIPMSSEYMRADPETSYLPVTPRLFNRAQPGITILPGLLTFVCTPLTIPKKTRILPSAVMDSVTFLGALSFHVIPASELLMTSILTDDSILVPKVNCVYIHKPRRR